MEKPDSVTIDLEFDCPFCGKGVGYSKDRVWAFHEEPMCRKFDKLEAGQFLIAARKELERRLN